MTVAQRLAAGERWLTPTRMRVAALLLLGVNLLATATWIASLKHLMDPFHQPLGGDFIIFYAASSLTLKGHALSVFSAPALLAAERAAVSGTPAGLLWCYPPPFQMIIAPLALAPYAAAFALWSALGVAGYLAVIRRILGRSWPLCLAFAFPGLFVTLWAGQTSLFVFTVLGGGLMLLDRRPWIAGAVLGLLICKPQFALLLPLLMLGTGRWRSIGGAAVSVTALSAFSALLFGAPLWRAFLFNLPDVSSGLTLGQLPWSKMPSLFVSLSWIGVPRGPALMLQSGAALAAAVAVLRAWRRDGDLALKAALAVLAALIVTPYSFNYDLVLLAFPIAAAAAASRRRSLPLGTKLSLGLAVLAPGPLQTLAHLTHLQLTPVAILLAFMAVWRTCAQPTATGAVSFASPSPASGDRPLTDAAPAPFGPQPSAV